MNTRVVFESAPFREWLHTATRSLCDEASARVTDELTDHFGNAVELEIQQGRTSKEAEESALAALGSPRKARRRLLKTNLTERESRELAAIICEPSRGVANLQVFSVIVALMSIGAIAWRLVWKTHHFGPERWMGNGFSVMALFYVAIVLPYWFGPLLRQGLKLSTRVTVQTVAWAQVSIFALWVAVDLIEYRHFLDSDAIGVSLLAITSLVIGAVYTWPTFHLARKLPQDQGPVRS